MPDGSNLVLMTRDGHVSTVTLNAADKRNAMSLELRAQLADALAAGMKDPEVRAIVLTGAGPHFCAGGDIGGMTGANPVSSRFRLESGHRIIRTIVEGEKVVIAAVEGFAVGAGISLAAACDIVVAARTARFACSFNRIGLVPDFGAAFLLPMRMGLGRAKRVMLTGDTFGAEEAERWGLVEDLAPAGEALAAATTLAHRIAGEAAPLSNAFSKRLLARLPGSLGDLLMAEADSQAPLYVSADFAEGRNAFLAKRKPRFEGR